ncbi:hypothetical protein LEP1GSC062_2372 [Leptospira alexanderi serovar Manhao 3 str. L 60]|uniref:Uncharacterized protein n=1 Tax=Leptospira alexanderi serovar Manhao 3 str. L 60 TaxID=1049759 RepID=V6I3J1_9LEPT|nr:hypothetical protein LEP1GSC062_2372 [Leptospira alexanderi serovar Manhao 3 str. L 60]
MARDRAFRSNSFGISTTIAFAFCYTELTLNTNQFIQSMSRKGNCYDNAPGTHS